MNISEKNKILLIAPKDGVIGGISNWTKNLLTFYNSNQNNIQLDLFDFSRNRSGYVSQNFFQKILWAITDYLILTYKSIKKIKKSEAGLVHIVTSASFLLLKDIFLLTMVKNNNKKSIIHFHFGRIPDLYKQNNWEKKLIDIVIKLSDTVIVIDKKSYDTLINYGFENIELLPNPLTSKVLDIIVNNKFIIRNNRTLLFAGHVVKTKGVYELIDACKQIDNIKLKIIGRKNTEIEHLLKQKAGKNCDKWLEIAGENDFESTIKEMLSSGIFVLPTYTEGFPNVIIESMACGCPIVTTKVGAIPEILDIENGENCGLCVEPKNVEQLRDAILRMLDNNDFALRCGLNAQKRVKEMYSMPIVWKQLEGIWLSTSLKKNKNLYYSHV